MHLVTLILWSTFLTKGSTLTCFQCTHGHSGTCVDKQLECPASNLCGVTRLTSYMGSIQMADVSLTACVTPLQCITASVNYGISRTFVNSQCCSTELCNSQNIPVLNDSRPNGRRCFYCDSEDCENVLHCLGDENYCVSAEVGNMKIPLKGCASQAVCMSTGAAAALMGGGTTGDVSCCEGNLCNGGGGRVSVTLHVTAAMLSAVFLFK